MFDLSFAEIILVAVVGVIFIGPKDLPVIMRAIAKGMKSVRGLTNEIRAAFDEVSRESGLKEAAEDIAGEVRLIRGDDGKLYESYDVSGIVKKDEPPAV